MGNATARAISFRNRDSRNAIYPNSHWTNLFGAADYRFLEDGGTAGRNLDARTMFYYGYTVNTPAMIAKMLGKGWFAILRLYGPLEPWFDKTWRPGDGVRAPHGRRRHRLPCRSRKKYALKTSS